MRQLTFTGLMLFILALGSCGSREKAEDLEAFDTTNQSHDIDTFKNKHMIYDNP